MFLGKIPLHPGWCAPHLQVDPVSHICIVSMFTLCTVFYCLLSVFVCVVQWLRGRTTDDDPVPCGVWCLGSKRLFWLCIWHFGSIVSRFPPIVVNLSLLPKVVRHYYYLSFYLYSIFLSVCLSFSHRYQKHLGRSWSLLPIGVSG